MTTIDLVVLGQTADVSWPGRMFTSDRTPTEVARTLDRVVEDDDAAWVLIWDERLSLPDFDAVVEIAERRGEVFHAGLSLGTGGLPRILDLIRPAWMLNGDPDHGIDATSWRLTLSACLIRRDVLTQVGGVDPSFDSLTGAALEMGLRYLDAGVIIRHIPDLCPVHAAEVVGPPTVHDEFLIARRADRRWLTWALVRSLRNGYSARSALAAYRAALRQEVADRDRRFGRLTSGTSLPGSPDVSVIIATLDRLTFLRSTLRDLSAQTVRPSEVIVVDQSDPPVPSTLPDEFPALPIRLLRLDAPGQSSARNLAIKASSGELLMFVDDDVEMDERLIESHLRLIESLHADVSCGPIREMGAQGIFVLPDRVCLSPVLPAGNSILKRSVLYRSGLFDLAFDRGARADHDLGTRIYRSGGLMLVNPDARLTHLRASKGGLRTHGARVRTFAASRTALRQRHLPSGTELYLLKRYFSPRQGREASLIRLMGTFQTRGGPLRRALKALIGLVQLPHTLVHFQRTERAARAMLDDYPRIEQLDPTSVSSHAERETSA